jgi:adenylate kinase family enzyme
MAAAAAEVLASSISFVAGSGEALVAVSEILAVVLAGLAVSQIPALVTAFVALTAGLTATGIATTIFTSIVTAARLALIALGGPLGLVYGILGSGAAAWVLWADNTKEGETAIDNVTLAMGDNIKQANSLFTLMGTGQTITQSAALAKLSEAEAHLRTADALREERDAVLSLQQAQLTLNYQRETEALNSIRAGTDAYEEREQSIVRILSNMGDLQAIQQSANGDFAAATAEVERIRKAIGNAVDGMVTFDGEVITAIDLGNRLATAITNISFDNAISGASFLANDLGVNIELANKFNATLDRSAGIEAPKPAAGGTRGLGFGLGNADTGAIQSVTLAYGDLSGSAKEVDAAIKRLSSTNIQAEKTLSSVSSAISGGGAKSGLTPALTDAEKATQSYADTMQGFVVDGIGKAVDNMVDGFTGGLKSIKDIFVATIKQMISFAIKNKIMLSLGMGGSAMGTAASAATGGAGGLGGSLAGIGSLGSVFAGSLSGTASAFMSGGIGAGIGQIGATLGAVTGSLGSLAAAAGAIALPLLAVVGVFKFFGKSTKLLDQGLQLTVKGMNSVVESFSKTKTSRFFGLSSRTSTSTSQLDAAAASPLTNAIDGIQKSVLSAAAGLGIGADAFSKFSFGFKLSLNGLTEEQKMSAVTAELAKMGDAFAAVVPGISSLNELLAVSAERYNLQNRVLELQGKGEELLARQRKAQMNATNDLNKAILKQIFNLEDASIAQEKTNALAEEAAQAAAQAQAALFSSINENDFATGVDFRRGLARASSGIEYSPQQSQAEMLAELKALNARIDMLQSTSEITANSSRQTAENTDFSNALTLDAAA